MKTAISIPDEIFDAADELARRLGLSRSELYVRAVRQFVDRERRTDLTARLNEVYRSGDGDLDPTLAALQRASLDAEDW
jgi:metal-responsive CopG/Arc/MetJ family transcriptional regulator